MGPQLEDGFTRIANELLEGLARLRLPGEAMQIFLVIMRQTYGYRRKEDAISLGQFTEKTGMPRQSVQRAIRRLLEQNIIKKKQGVVVPTYEINKLYSSWGGDTKLRMGRNIAEGGDAKLRRGGDAKLRTTKEKNKESLKKDTKGGWLFSDYLKFHQQEIAPMVSPLMLSSMKEIYEAHPEEDIKEIYLKSTCCETTKRFNYIWKVHKSGGVKKEASIWDMELED